MTSSLRFFAQSALLVFALATIALTVAAPSDAAIIASETFDSYTGFDDSSDPKNPGVPVLVDGADSPYWLAARLGVPEVPGTIDSDVGVQKVGHGTGTNNNPPYNLTPAGYARDKNGLVMRLDLTNYENVLLDFDWRTHRAENHDRFIAAYHQGDGLGLPNGTYDWFNDPLKGNGNQATFDAWYNANFTPIVDFGGSSGFPFASVTGKPLPGGDILYLVFWLKNINFAAGDGDAELAKVDNIVITGDLVVPEPATGVLLAMSLALLPSLALRRRAN